MKTEKKQNTTTTQGDKIKILISKAAEEAAKAVIVQLKKQDLIKDTKRKTPYQKIETLLYDYKSYVAAVESKREQIKNIKIGLEEIPQKSKSVTLYGGNYYSSRDELDKIEERISSIQKSMRITENFINIVEEALKTIQNDNYYNVIIMNYFDNKTREDIAEFYKCDVSTITRNKKRLINQLQIRIFSDEVIREMFGL